MSHPTAAQSRPAARPRTTATTNRFDESRIKKKLEILEKMEQRIEDDIQTYQAKPQLEMKAAEKGVFVTPALLLEASQCDELSEI